MKQIAKTKLPRKILILAFLILGFVTVAADKSNCVEADTCDDAMTEFHNSMATYDTALRSYFYGSPTTCDYECRNITNPTAKQQCVNDCQTTRHTALGAAEIDLFSAAGGTCTAFTVDECARARDMANTCAAQYNYMDYTDPEEFSYIYTQYSACREASKIDGCQ